MINELIIKFNEGWKEGDKIIVDDCSAKLDVRVW